MEPKASIAVESLFVLNAGLESNSKLPLHKSLPKISSRH